MAELGMAGLGVTGLDMAVDDSRWIVLPLDWVSQSLILATTHRRPDAR